MDRGISGSMVPDGNGRQTSAGTVGASMTGMPENSRPEPNPETGVRQDYISSDAGPSSQEKGIRAENNSQAESADTSRALPVPPPAKTANSVGVASDVHCYGKNSEQYADRLHEFIGDEYRDFHYYCLLARRAPSSCAGRILRRIAKDERSHLAKFSAAYFLITGKRYAPSPCETEPASVPSSFSRALRERYLAEYGDFGKYMAFAAKTDDPCLKALATKVSEDEHQHAELILDIIESMSCME